MDACLSGEKSYTVFCYKQRSQKLIKKGHCVKCKCRECNTFAMVRIHAQMFQAMSVKRYQMTNVLIFHYTSYDFVFQSWPHKNDFQTEHLCILSG